MAKKKKDPVTRFRTLMASAKDPHQYDAGVGGDIYDPLMSNIRGIRLPSLGMMNMLGFTALRDSCTMLIDGGWGSSKSSLGIDVFNWGLPYGAGGGLLDCENKGAFDIAHGMLNKITIWLPGHFVMRTCTSVEAAQTAITELVNKCTKVNKDMPRDEHIPYIQVTDSLAGISSDGTLKNVEGEGHSNRGHAGREEALLWSTFMKTHQTQLHNVAMISVFINHQKERAKKIGMHTINEKYNPGGVAQNYHATIHLTCAKKKRQVSEAVDGISYDEIKITCMKNSRGPTGKQIIVRKNSQRNEDGTTSFWWDWGGNTVDFLSSVSSAHPASKLINISVTKATRIGSCAEVGLTNVPISDIGDAIMADDELRTTLVKTCRLYQLKEFTRFTPEEYTDLLEVAEQAKQEYIAEQEKKVKRANEATYG